MKSLLLTGLLFFGQMALIAPVAMAATAEKKESFQLIHVADLEKWATTEKGKVFVYDANTKETRAKEGVIPGATLLPSTQYNAQTTLPADKNAKLVFYCANTMCMASHEAAKKATDAGYKNVYVMTDGIQGWTKAGKKADKFTP